MYESCRESAMELRCTNAGVNIILFPIAVDSPSDSRHTSEDPQRTRFYYADLRRLYFQESYHCNKSWFISVGTNELRTFNCPLNRCPVSLERNLSKLNLCSKALDSEQCKTNHSSFELLIWFLSKMRYVSGASYRSPLAQLKR